MQFNRLSTLMYTRGKPRYKYHATASDYLEASSTTIVIIDCGISFKQGYFSMGSHN